MKAYRASKHAPWVNYDTVVASLTAMADAERTAAHIPTKFFKISEMMENLEVRVSSNDNSTPLTGVLHAYGARKGAVSGAGVQQYDDIARIGSMAMTTGAQVATSGKYYVHIMIPTSHWHSELHMADHEGNNGMSRFMFDVSGYDIVFFRITFSGADKEWRVDLSGV